MASSDETIYWDSLGQSLALGTAYRVNLPVGTTEWAVYNTSGGTIGVAGTAATIAVPANTVAIPTGQPPVTGKGQSLFVGNATGGALTIVVRWSRQGRQPTNDAGTASFTAL